MKTFKDLEFRNHSNELFSEEAKMEFENGYGISVITGDLAYSSDDAPYEVAVLHLGELCYDTPITDDVIGYQTEEDITLLMKQIQELI